MSTRGPNAVTHQPPRPPASPPPAAPPAGARPAPPPGLVVPGQPAACHPGHPGGNGGAQRPVVVVVGGGATFVPGRGPAPDPGRLADAARGVRHPGHAGSHRPPAGAQPRPVDPQLTALGVLLGDAAPPASAPGLGQRIAGQLLVLLDAAALRLGAALQRGGGDDAATVLGGGPGASDAAQAGADAADPTLAQLPVLRMPQQPPGPMLTLDPTLGTIVHDSGAGGGGSGGGRGIGEVPLGATPTLGDGGAGDAAGRRPSVPSSWVPVSAYLTRLGAAGRAGAARAMDAVDRVIERAGISRGQFVLLMLLLPLAVALLLDALASLAGSLG